MTLKESITEDMKLAMRQRASDRLSAIRLLLAACKQVEVDERIVLTDSDVVRIVDKLIKQRKDSVVAYQSAGRIDLAEKELAEIGFLEVYLPVRMTEAEIDEALKSILLSLGSESNLGQVMQEAKRCLAGKADMAVVSQKVKMALMPPR